MNYIIRNIKVTDLYKGYIDLLKQLSTIETINITEFNNFINNLNNNHMILVIEDTEKCSIIGTITILIESKIIHNMGKVCHIEDVVVDKNYRLLGLGKLLIDKAKEIAINEKCYKIILNCNEKNINFYKKSDLSITNTQMGLYL